MSIIPYKCGKELAQRIDSIISDSGLRVEVKKGVHEAVRTILVFYKRAKVDLLVGPGNSPEIFLVRMGYRDGVLHLLFHGDRDVELAKRVESILRTAPASDIVAEAEWLGGMLTSE
jgi:hypothetical protein